MSALSSSVGSRATSLHFLGVVRERRGQVAHGRLALHLHEVLVVVDVERRLGGVVDVPDHHRGDLDRVAALVVDLEPVAVQVARAQRQLLARVERVGGAQARHAAGAAIGAEELDDRRLVGLQRVQPGQRQHGGDQQHDARREQAPRESRTCRWTAPAPGRRRRSSSSATTSARKPLAVPIGVSSWAAPDFVMRSIMTLRKRALAPQRPFAPCIKMISLTISTDCQRPLGGGWPAKGATK